MQRNFMIPAIDLTAAGAAAGKPPNFSASFFPRRCFAPNSVTSTT